MPCRSLALTAQGGVILATLPPAVVSSPKVSWPQLLHEALKGDAQPRTLPKVLVIAFCNIYEFAEEEHFVNCNVSDISRSVEVSASVAGSIGDVEVVPESCFYSVRVAVHHVAGAVGDDSARPSTRRTAGHYRCHIRQGHRWYIADDSIVKESPEPPGFFPRLVFLECSEEFMGNRLLPHCSDDVDSQSVKKRPATSDNVAKKRPAMSDGALPAQKRAREQSEDGREHADVASATSSVVSAAAPQRDNTRAQDRSGRDQCGRVQERDQSGRQRGRVQDRDQSGRKQIRELSPRARRVDVVDIRDLPLKRYMQHLACPESELEPALRSWSERGIMESKLPIPCRLCGVSFTMESEACAHFDVFHGGLKHYREEFLCLEACRPHVVKGEEWRHILANFSEFSTQAAKSWNERQKQRRAPRSRCMSGCCICARSFWSEELTLAPFAGPDSPILNSSSVAKLLSAKRYFEKWPLYLWEELEASSIVLGGELILVNSKRVPDDALEKDKWSPAPWCQDCSRSLWQKSPKMPKFALAAGCFLGRIQKPFRDMHSGNFEQLQKRRGFAHRLLLPIARPISTKVVLQQDESAPADPWAYAFIQKGLRGSCVLLPNASVADANEFPPADLGEAFVAAFVGADSTDLSKAQFGTVHREEFEEQADFLRNHNARYQRSRYNRDVVRNWPAAGESVPAEISNMIVPFGKEEDGIGAMRQKGPAEEVEAESGSAELDESTAWTAALTDVDLSCLPRGWCLRRCIREACSSRAHCRAHDRRGASRASRRWSRTSQRNGARRVAHRLQ